MAGDSGDGAPKKGGGIYNGDAEAAKPRPLIHSVYDGGTVYVMKGSREIPPYLMEDAIVAHSNPPESLAWRLHDGKISLDERVALNNFLQKAYQKDGFDGVRKLIVDINANLRRFKSDFRLIDRVPESKSTTATAYDLLNMKDGKRNALTECELKDKPQPLPSATIATKLQGHYSKDNTTIKEAFHRAAYAVSPGQSTPEQVDQFVRDINGHLSWNSYLMIIPSESKPGKPSERAYDLVNTSTGTVKFLVDIDLNRGIRAHVDFDPDHDRR